MFRLPPISLTHLAVMCASLAFASCARHGPAVVGPPLDPGPVADHLEQATTIREPIRVVFTWHLNEAGMRVSGRGVARVEPPYRARLDLFLGNGETIVRAALVDGDLRLPPGAPENILPPADLMWGVLGVFRRHEGITLNGAGRMEGDDVQLRYGYDDGSELHYRLSEGRIARMELLEEGHVVKRVELDLEGGERYPLEATYRDMRAFRELRMERESLQAVEPFPSDIWSVVR
jgi:hypothetical protein